ncbi:MAG TPA: CHAD domain-containing protein [Propionibacteriaceae bacterium]
MATPPAGSIGALLCAYVTEQHDAMLGRDPRPGAQARLDDRARHAVLGLEAAVQTFQPVFTTRPAAQLLGELGWLVSLLGEVRDRELLCDRIKARLASLSELLVLGPVQANVERVLGREQTEHLERLREAVDSDRYRQLLATLGEWRSTPPLARKAARPSATVAKFLTRAADELDQELVGTQLDRGPEHLARARRAARQLHRATEVGGGNIGRKATKRVERAQRLADLLEELASSLRVAEFLQRVGPTTDPDAEHNGFTYGLLYEQELRRAAVLRGQLEHERRR